MTTFEVVLVARTPRQTITPTLTPINRLVVDNFSYIEELNRPGSAIFGCPIGSLADDVKTRLANVAVFPSEVWVYQDASLAWAGEIQTLAVEEQSVNLGCVGLLGYTYRMGVTSDLTYTGIDQFAIAKGLVDHWQALDYGNYGIDTSGIGTSGVTRDRVYLRDELHNIGERLAELRAVLDGFDTHVDPVTRALVLSYPERGTDRTGTVFLDERSIDSASVAMSVGTDDLVTEVAATGTGQASDGTNSTIYMLRSNTSLRSSYGRSWTGINRDGVSVAGTLEAAADAYRDARNGQLFQPGVTVLPRPGTEIGSFHPGDTISYVFDAGLGVQAAGFRVAKVKVDVDSDGKQRLGVEFT